MTAVRYSGKVTSGKRYPQWLRKAWFYIGTARNMFLCLQLLMKLYNLSWRLCGDMLLQCTGGASCNLSGPKLRRLCSAWNSYISSLISVNCPVQRANSMLWYIGVLLIFFETHASEWMEPSHCFALHRFPPASPGFCFCEFTYLSRASEETYGCQFPRQWLAILFYVARAAVLLEKLPQRHGVYVYGFRYSCITSLTVPWYSHWT